MVRDVCSGGNCVCLWEMGTWVVSAQSSVEVKTALKDKVLLIKKNVLTALEPK